ncbi:MAG: helix-turn-helix transcriptional regulator [Ruminiclostridium sp.]|nr:helix-turn-helix transcriptional regulator [Ruminiclostridium sp.]
MDLVTKNVKQIINEKGLIQKRVAQRAGIEEKTFSNMLNGRKKICDTDVLNIAYALNVTPNDLFGLSSGEQESGVRV